MGIASVYAFAGMLPPKYMGALFFGSGLSGIIVAIVRVICLSKFPNPED
jgi:hypothetical protein